MKKFFKKFLITVSILLSVTLISTIIAFSVAPKKTAEFFKSIFSISNEDFKVHADETNKTIEQLNIKITELEEKNSQLLLDREALDLKLQEYLNSLIQNEELILSYELQIEALTARIEENTTLIQELRDYINSLTVELVSYIVDLPESFSNANSIYFVQIDEDTLLFSSNNRNSGLWLCRISENSFTQIYTLNCFYNKCLKLDDNLYMLWSVQNIQPPLFYSAATHSIVYTTDLSFAGDFDYQGYIGNKFVFSFSNCNGLYVVDSTVPSIINLNTPNGRKWRYALSYNANEHIFISQYYGLLYYNSLTDDYSAFTKDNFPEIESIYTAVQTTETKVLFGGDNNLYEFDLTTKTVRLVENFSGRNIVKLNDTKFVVSKSSSSGTGFGVYDTVTSTFKVMCSSGYNFKYITKLTDTKYLISGDNGGTYLYDTELDEATQIHTGNKLFAVKLTDTQFIVSCNAQYGTTGLYLLNILDNSIKQIYTYGYDYSSVFDLGDGLYLISSHLSNSGLIVYDLNKGSYTRAYETGMYDTFIEDEEGVTVEFSNKSKCAMTLYYTKATKTAKLIKYYVEIAA